MKNKIILFSLFALTFVGCKKEEPKKPGKLPFPVVAVQTQNVTGYQTFPASIEGILNNDVRAKIQGYITQVFVDEGQFVTKGQPLFRLETNILSQNADAAKSSIAAARANVTAARAGVNAAQVEVNKLIPLVEKKIISNIQLQTARANLAEANAKVQQAIAAQQQEVAGLKGIQANIDYSIIRAPISGVIGKLPLKVGSLVGPTDQIPLTTISDTKEIYAYFSMNEKEYFDFLEKSPGATMPEKIRNLPMVQLELANGSLYAEKGKIETVTGTIDPSTGTIQFRVGFPNAKKLLSNGNSGNIRFPNYYENVLVIPESATYEQQGIVYAFKVDQDTARNTVIKVQKRLNNLAIVSEGLKKGDKVVAAGIGGLKDRTAIIPKPINMDSLVKTIKPIFE